MSQPVKILFVCLGNICRSPAAEGVMLSMVRDAGLEDVIRVDSAGTGGWHAGQLPDHRMRTHALKRGYTLDSKARQVRSSDFEDFDFIIVMDRQNLEDMRPFAPQKKHMEKVMLFCNHARDRKETEVPDPYYGGAAGFEQVLDILENGCTHLLASLQRSRPGMRVKNTP